MADTKRKRRDDGKRGREKSKMNGKKQKSSDSRAQLKSGGRRKKSGPHLPSSLQKEIERLNPTAALNSDEDIASDDYNEEEEIYGKDVYELDEERAEEESQKNKRYDQVGLDKFEYELPDELSDDFKDEDLESDDENVDDDDYWGTKDEKAVSDDSEGEDDGRHTRMLQALTGMPSEAFEGVMVLSFPLYKHTQKCVIEPLKPFVYVRVWDMIPNYVAHKLRQKSSHILASEFVKLFSQQITKYAQNFSTHF